MPPSSPVLDVVSICLSVAPVPYLAPAFDVFRSLWTSIENIKWSRQQLEALAFSIAQLLPVLNRRLGTNKIQHDTVSSRIEDLKR